ncbi:hypothetical protein BDZ91DRAFT_757437 [Kalaharituber pfeilii]|nr:hypothetical protein BDZ91DRAFT_757437 [Kalaharituber pfeilii]
MFGLKTLAITPTVTREDGIGNLHIEYYERKYEYDTDSTELLTKNEEAECILGAQTWKPVTYEPVDVQNSEINDTVNDTVDNDVSTATHVLDNKMEDNATTIVTFFQNTASITLSEVSSYEESITSSAAETESSTGFCNYTEYSTEAIEKATPAFSGFISKIPRPCQSRVASTSTAVIHSGVTSFCHQETAKPGFVSMIPKPVTRVEPGNYAASSKKAAVEAEAASRQPGTASRRSMIPRPVKGNENVNFAGMSARTRSARYTQGCKLPRKISMNVVRE